MSEHQNSHLAPQTSSADVDPEVTQVAKELPTRRLIIKGVAVTVGAVAAAGYVKPNLRSLGVPEALAGISSPPPPPPPPSPGPAQGCSPGFYKTGHPGSRLIPTSVQDTSFFTIFNLPPGTCGLPDPYTLQNAVDNPGGQAATLAFQAAAAYYNAIRAINYPLTSAQVVAEVNVAFQGCDPTTMASETGRLDRFNNLEGVACS